jgi:hypothetical protein
MVDSQLAFAWCFFLLQLHGHSFSGIFFRWIRPIAESHGHLCLQVAELDQYAGEIRNGCDALQQTASELRASMVNAANDGQ